MNMSCANPECKAELKYLRGGRLFLMERRPSLAQHTTHDPLRPKPPVMMRRYFWLCENCAKIYSIQRWTDDGIELVLKRGVKRSPPAFGAGRQSRDWTVPGLVG